jgi:hypothetical protein
MSRDFGMLSRFGRPSQLQLFLLVFAEIADINCSMRVLLHPGQVILPPSCSVMVR